MSKEPSKRGRVVPKVLTYKDLFLDVVVLKQEVAALKRRVKDLEDAPAPFSMRDTPIGGPEC